MLEQARVPAQRLVEALASGEAAEAMTSAASLAGLGGGLTPSGDDFIIGAMYALRLYVEPARADEISRHLADASGAKTVRISQAWLKAAARGEASLTWHRLCGALLKGDPAGIESSARDLLAVGHTSGADALAGFIMGVAAFASV
jgi:hypothetical protein